MSRGHLGQQRRQLPLPIRRGGRNYRRSNCSQNRHAKLTPRVHPSRHPSTQQQDQSQGIGAKASSVV
jgi:hypothetical protein